MKNRYILCIALVISLCFGFSVFAQDAQNRQGSNSGLNQSVPNADMNQVILARSSGDYRVTAGDIYTLAYSAGTTPVTYVISVDTSYRIRVANLGFVNGAGKTFMQVKSEVEAVVTNNYPLSGVQLVLTQPAIFRVYVKGEVPAAEEVSVWALTRLSSLVNETELSSLLWGDASVAANPFPVSRESSVPSLVSLRDVSIRSSNGQVKVYDLFKAQRLGDRSQDPYLRPGDVVTFNRAKRLVAIAGEVERPETYQLLDDENINELIEFYGDGFTPLADKTRIELVRMVNSTDVSGDKIFLSENDLENNYVLENFDVVTVPMITQLQPVMFVEGAVAQTWQSLGDTGKAASSEAQDLASSTRLVVRFNAGETYASLVRNNNNWFLAVSDTQNAYILRNNQRISINLNPMLYDVTYRDSVLVQENDVLIIPFRQYFVTVAGAVASPGRYPYIPDRDWEYYIALAGGFVMDRNTAESVVITDINGKKMKKSDAIVPETTITANTNHFLFFFNQYAPVVTTILGLVTTIFTILAVTSK